MDSEPRRSGSFSRITNSSFRRPSFNFSGGGHHEADDDSVSEAGDIGERELNSKRYSGSGRSRFSFDNLAERPIVPVEKESQLPTASPDPILRDKEQIEECKKELPWFLTYVSSRIHLAVLGILGVLTRYLLEKLFSPDVGGATSDQSYMYVDLPPNMVGSFLMGWFGTVFKGDISKFSPELAVGLTTGYLGSLTTFSGWNQKMLELSVNDRWLFSVLGFLIGLSLVFCSFIYGVGTAKVFSTGYLWFGCIVGPIGVWIRFYLAKLNGQGLGNTEIMKWMPFGTLIANVAASCIMATFATLKKDVKREHFDIVATGIQFGLCGCLSTVSTFIAEFGAMIDSTHPWRACVYALTTIILSFTLGTLIYSVPVWIKGWS